LKFAGAVIVLQKLEVVTRDWRVYWFGFDFARVLLIRQKTVQPSNTDFAQSTVLMVRVVFLADVKVCARNVFVLNFA
jgi:hypothetical protein